MRKNGPSKRYRSAVHKKALRKPTCKSSAWLIVRILSTYEACIFSLHQGAMSYGSYEGKKEKKPLTDTIRDSANSENMIHFIYFSIYVISTIGYIRNSQWLALQLLWLAQWIERCVVWGSIPWQALIFQVLFQPLRLFIQLRRSCSLSYLDLQFKNVVHFLYIYFSVRRVVASMRKEVEILTSNCD